MNNLISRLMTNFLSRHVSMAAQTDSDIEGLNAAGNLMIGGYLASLAVERGHFMLLTVFLGFLLLVMLANQKERSARIVTIAILLTVLVWNPLCRLLCPSVCLTPSERKDRYGIDE